MLLVAREAFYTPDDIRSNACFSKIADFMNRCFGDIEFRADTVIERYKNQLDPCLLVNRQFSQDEDLKLLQLYQKYGRAWTLIARELKTKRSDHQVMQRARFLLNQETQNQKKVKREVKALEKEVKTESKGEK